jgi:membrane-bound lytic murein transglycosylase B
MPSTFRAYALDADGDQRIDLWNSLPDALHSAGHYLQRAGWQAGAPVALAVQLPAGFDWRRARYAHRLDTQAWSAQGVRLADGSALPARGRAAIILPQGWQGPAFMVFDNFDVVMQWNRSVNYALSVASLAERLAGAAAPGVATGESGALSTAQLTAMQQALNELGFNAGAADGFMGPRTQTALRLYQVKHGLPADGYPAPTVFAHIEQTHASAANAGKLSRAPEPVFADPAMP